MGQERENYLDKPLDRQTRLLSGQMRVLELIATGAPLAAALDELVLFIEAQEEGLTCGILLVAPDREHLVRGSGPNLPEAYHQALDGVPITPPYLGACGCVAHIGESVRTDDVANDDRWSEEWRDLVLSCGLRSCLSSPVVAADGTVLATFAMYFDSVRDPRPSEPELVEIATHLASIAIERERETVLRTKAQDELQRSEAHLARELQASRHLQSISSRLIVKEDVSDLYESIVNAAMALMDADAASLQMLQAATGDLKLLAWKGFQPEDAAYWHLLDRNSPSSCGAAFGGGSRVVFEDLEETALLRGTECLEHYRHSGLRAVQSTPLVSRTGQILGMLSTHWKKPHRPNDAELGLFDVLARQAADLIERAQTETARRQNEERLDQIINSAREYAIVTLDEAGRITSWNEGARRLLGYEEHEVLGQTGHIFFTPEDRAAGVPESEMTTALSAGRAANERWHIRKDGSRFWGSGAMLLLDKQADAVFLKIFRDRTEEQLAEERRMLLINELNHRVKNTLATVQSIVARTLRGAEVDEAVRDGLEARLAALARAHDVLTRRNWSGAKLDEVIRNGLAPFADAEAGGERFTIDGPSVQLSPNEALSLALGIHELATNATKYGALSGRAARSIYHGPGKRTW